MFWRACKLCVMSCLATLSVYGRTCDNSRPFCARTSLRGIAHCIEMHDFCDFILALAQLPWRFQAALMQLCRSHVAHPVALVRVGSVISKFCNRRVHSVCFALFAGRLEIAAAGAVAPVLADARFVPSCARCSPQSKNIAAFVVSRVMRHVCKFVARSLFSCDCG